MPEIGDYRDRVTILTRSLAATDGLGEQVESWPDPDPADGDRWAMLESIGGTEDVGAGDRREYLSVRIRFRNLVALAAVDRVRVKVTGETYNVVGVWRERSESGGWQTVADLRGVY